MRRSLVLLAMLTAVAASPLVASASEIITIDVTSGGDIGTYTLTVPSGVLTPPVVDTVNGDFELNNIAVTGPGYSGSDSVFFYDATQGGGMFDPSFMNLNFDSGTVTGNPATFVAIPMFGGTLSSPSFTPGTGMITYDSGLTGFNDTIADVPVTPGVTPEPSSLMLLGTGALAVAGSFRRRILARA